MLDCYEKAHNNPNEKEAILKTCRPYKEKIQSMLRDNNFLEMNVLVEQRIAILNEMGKHIKPVPVQPALI